MPGDDHESGSQSLEPDAFSERVDLATERAARQAEQDKRWSGATIDGRAHRSVREGYRVHAHQLRGAVQTYYTLSAIASGTAHNDLWIPSRSIRARIPHHISSHGLCIQ